MWLLLDLPTSPRCPTLRHWKPCQVVDSPILHPSMIFALQLEIWRIRENIWRTIIGREEELYPKKEMQFMYVHCCLLEIHHKNNSSRLPTKLLGILENTNQVILCCHLKCGHGLYCDSTVALDSLHYFFDQYLEHCLWNQQTCCIFVKEFFLGVWIRISSVSLVFPNLFQCYSASRSETVRPKPSISAQRVASHDRLHWAKFLLLWVVLPGGRKAASGVIICFANMLLLSFINGNSGCNPPQMFMGKHNSNRRSSK